MCDSQRGVVSARRTYDTQSIALRRIFAYDSSNNMPFPPGFILTSLTKGDASFVSPNVTLSTIGFSNLPATISTISAELLSTAIQYSYTYTSSAVIFLPSTVEGLGTSGYLSTSALGPYFASTNQNLGSLGYISTSFYDANTISTVQGLGTLGYISSAILTNPITSSIIGLGTLGYVSSTQLASTVTGLASSDYISSSQLTSSLLGLGTLGYISSAQLFSTISSLGTLGYVSTSQLTSTTIGLGTIGFVSSSQITSSLTGAGTIGFVSSSQLTSSLVGAGTLGYLSTNRIFRSTYSNLITGNWSNVGYLFSSISTNIISLSTIRFDLGPSLRSQIIPSTTKLDIELKPNLQFAYYDVTSRDYQFNSFLCRGSSFSTTNIIGQESLTYYILNANAINLSFFFQEKTRFLINNPTILSTLRNDGQFSTLTLQHTFGSRIPTTNQFFASPASSICATVTLDNTV